MLLHLGVPVFFSFLALLLASFLPRVEDPLPDRIGLGLPFAAAAAGGVLAGMIFVRSAPARRERAMRWGGLAGFGLGAVVYLVALLVQVASEIR